MVDWLEMRSGTNSPSLLSVRYIWFDVVLYLFYFIISVWSEVKIKQISHAQFLTFFTLHGPCISIMCFFRYLFCVNCVWQFWQDFDKLDKTFIHLFSHLHTWYNSSSMWLTVWLFSLPLFIIDIIQFYRYILFLYNIRIVSVTRGKVLSNQRSAVSPAANQMFNLISSWCH